MESAPSRRPLSRIPHRGDGGALRLDLDADMDEVGIKRAMPRSRHTPVGKVTDDPHPDFPLFVGQLGGKAMPGRPRVTIGERSKTRWRNVSDDPRFAPRGSASGCDWRQESRNIFIRGGVAMGMSDPETYIQAMRKDDGDVLSRSAPWMRCSISASRLPVHDVTSLVDAALADPLARRWSPVTGTASTRPFRTRRRQSG